MQTAVVLTVVFFEANFYGRLAFLTLTRRNRLLCALSFLRPLWLPNGKERHSLLRRPTVDSTQRWMWSVVLKLNKEKHWFVWEKWLLNSVFCVCVRVCVWPEEPGAPTVFIARTPRPQWFSHTMYATLHLWINFRI